jgi:hypothetical protein
MSKVTLVPTEHIDGVWNQAASLLKPAVIKSGGRWTMQDLYLGLVTGQLDLWIIYQEGGEIKASGVTMLKSYPNKTMIEVVFLGGINMSDWLEIVMDTLKSYAKALECDGVETVGRHGLSKAMKSHGFQKPYALYDFYFERKEL